MLPCIWICVMALSGNRSCNALVFSIIILNPPMLVFSELPEAEAINMMKLSLLTRTIGTLLRLMLNVMGILSLHGVQILP